jgi:hypothetical protein
MINLNTCDYINWDSIIKNLPEGNGDIIRGKNLLEIDPEEDIHQRNLLKEYTNCNYFYDGVGWDNYYKKDFIDTSFVDMFAKLVGCIERDCSISVVYPGMSAPKHWDIPLLTKLKSYDNLKRYMCFISEPAFGQVLIVKDNCYYNQPKGSIIEWDSYLDIHGASNIGFSPFYLFNFTGESYAGN